MSVDGISYPVLRVTAQGTRCILCDDAGVSDTKEHLESRVHRDYARDPERVQRLGKFHKFWMAQEATHQMDQQYVVQSRCVICDRKIAYDNVLVHMKSKGHTASVQISQKKVKGKISTI